MCMKNFILIFLMKIDDNQTENLLGMPTNISKIFF